MARLTDFLLELASVPSRLLNVLTGGTADLTTSARSHRDSLWSERPIDMLFRVFGQKRHCLWAWEREVERSRQNVVIAEKGTGR